MAIELSGFKELDDALGDLPRALRRPVMLLALRRAARPLVAEARSRAKRGTDPSRRGSKKQRLSGQAEAMGAAADSISARAEPATSEYEASVGVGPDKAHFYFRFTELGTARQPPRRTLTPSFETKKEEVLERLGAELWKAIDAAARRAANRHASRGTK